MKTSASSDLARRKRPPPISWRRPLAEARPKPISLAAGFTDNESAPAEEIRETPAEILRTRKTGHPVAKSSFYCPHQAQGFICAPPPGLRLNCKLAVNCFSRLESAPRGKVCRQRDHLARRPVHFSSAQDVAMQVRHGFAGVGAVVEDEPVAARFQAEFLRHCGGFEKQMA
jgi:hypothetical protein